MDTFKMYRKKPNSYFIILKDTNKLGIVITNVEKNSKTVYRLNLLDIEEDDEDHEEGFEQLVVKNSTAVNLTQLVRIKTWTSNNISSLYDDISVLTREPLSVTQEDINSRYENLIDTYKKGISCYKIILNNIKIVRKTLLRYASQV